MERTNKGELPAREDAHVRPITHGGSGFGGAGGGDGAALGRTGGVSGGPDGTEGSEGPVGPERGDGRGSAGGPGARGGPGGSGGPAGGPGRYGGPGGLGGFTAADEQRRRGVRRMKTIATGALLLMATVFVLVKWAGHAGAGGWTGYVAAAAEAGMVGALADWFAVTALFRHPMGLPIPHTAIIPTKKDQLGQSLGEFVGENFLSSDVVRTRLRAVGIGNRLGAWLAEPAHAERVTAELATALRGALTVLRDSDVQAIVSEAITRRATAQEVAPGLGTMLEKIVADGGHRRIVDLVCVRAAEWLELHSDSVMDAVTGGAPGWTPRFVDRKVGDRVYRELLRFVTEMRDMPDHPARGAVDRFLSDFAADLQSDPETRARVERLKNEVLGRGEVQDLIASAWGAVRSMLVAAAEDERSELRVRARSALLSLGKRMAQDGRLQGKVDGWVEGAAVYLVTTYRDEITSLISETVAGWDAEHTSKKIEAHIGRDLQFIRINGTVVGSLAGLAIYTVAQLFGV
ncbi:DUF445 domain-containing protein [Streptomyces sp. NBC_01795]|uniref:DUF445 domain-containing protein n=1 Tax=unclassified Streptomyces TaxID=2593676 RepID=UPI002DDC70D0|nr:MULTISPECIES: DUF445 domain-containing protein [unclassified Streptomyces]WSA94514.1 DUF445 domain-containing protein [Streptomyces sp. NBC_01795]WSB78933.1 DUF445 domain-containing protein [Streptomyces sp. NBC_01775]